jgi:Baseplate J-like protein
MTEPKNRVLAVVASTTINGIDFVEVSAPQVLIVHFLNAVPVADPSITAAITGGDSVPTVAVQPIDNATDWSSDAEGRPLLTLHTLTTGDFSNYLLTLTAPALDLILDSSTFSFKATCPSDFDCAPPPHVCPQDETVPPIDYLSRDYQSFRQSLLAFSSLRYPAWVERAEADLGLVIAELLSAVGDEFSYLQDGIAQEASLLTASQRRSLVSLARLVDYEPQPALSAATVLQCNVSASGTVPAGARISAAAPDGSLIPFEIGTSLADQSNYPVSSLWNFGIAPYWFDDDEQCCPQGATDLWVQGHGYSFTAGQALLIQTDLPGESLRQIVHLTAPGHEAFDDVFLTGGLPTPVTQLTWGTDEALPRALDLTRTQLGGNLLPATQGQRFIETFATGSTPPFAPNASLAIARRGPNSSDDTPNYVFRYPLGQAPLGWLSDGESPAPEILLEQLSPAASAWSFATTLLESLATDTDFTLDPIGWQVIARAGDGTPTHFDLQGDSQSTIRFGNNVFGASPAEQDLFQVTYRTGLGAIGNVAVDAITHVDPASAGLITSARNPQAVTSGADAESADHIRRMAPQAFRAVQYRAVLAQDYEAAAETLSWVQKACTSFRWTGSWMTVFTAVDPQGDEAISTAEHVQLIELLNRERLAGYESYAPPPQYVSLDLRIEVCVVDGWLNGDVEANVLNVLGSATRPDGSSGFFFADRFSFGTPLYRSRLDAAIQGAAGVAGVHALTYRQRGTFAGFIDLPEVVTPGPAQILRVDNDPSWPERGTIRVIAEGGR